MHTRPDVHALELKIPPVALVIIIAILMGLGAAYFPGFNFQFPFQSIVGWMIGLLGVIACALGILEFKRAKTTVNPTKPESSSSLVRSGIYRHTRNPINPLSAERRSHFAASKYSPTRSNRFLVSPRLELVGPSSRKKELFKLWKSGQWE